MCGFLGEEQKNGREFDTELYLQGKVLGQRDFGREENKADKDRKEEFKEAQFDLCFQQGGNVLIYILKSQKNLANVCQGLF